MNNSSSIKSQKLAASLLLASVLLLNTFSCAGLARETNSSSLGEAAIEKAEWIFDHATETHYQHLLKPATEQINMSAPDQCQADTDCSGFASYLINSVAPQQYQNICALQPGHEYPQAKTFVEYFLSLDGDNKGWQRLASYKDLHRGDFVAWAKPVNPDPTAKKGNTGHVMLVDGPVGAPASDMVDGSPVRYIPVPVLDCSSVSHFAPETLPPLAHQSQRDGLGKGTVRLILDDNGQICGYWEGTFSNVTGKSIKHPTLTSDIALARLKPLDQ